MRVGVGSEALRRAVDDVVGVDPGSLGDVGLADELLGALAQVDRLQGQVARLAHAAHVRGLGAVDRSPSTAAWLRRHAGMREGRARAAIDAGAGCDAVLAGTGEAWRSGQITAGAARTTVGARVDGHDAKLTALEPLLLGLARDRADRDLRRACAHFRNCAHAEGSSPRDHDGLTISQTDAGRTWLTADLSSDGAEIVLSAIHELTDPPTDDDPRSPARRRAAGRERPHRLPRPTPSPHRTRRRLPIPRLCPPTRLTDAHHVTHWRTADPPTSPTSSCSATTTTTSSTNPTGPSNSTATNSESSNPTAPSSSHDGSTVRTCRSGRSRPPTRTR